MLINDLTRAEMNMRQSQIIHERMKDLHVIIAGAGMVGSWAALGLVRIVGQLTILDFDKVEVANLGVQAFHASHEGWTKAEAIASMCEGYPVSIIEGTAPADFPELSIRPMPGRLDFRSNSA